MAEQLQAAEEAGGGIRLGDTVVAQGQTGPLGDLLLQASDDVRVRLPVFEGPLDLLLFLIRRQEIDIHEIRIETLTRDYLTALRSLERLRIDLAGEFFVMAATLMEIKSRMLLPRDLQSAEETGEEDGADPRWELVHQLLHYKRFKEAAAGLAELAEVRQNLLPRALEVPGRVPDSERDLQPVDRIELWGLFNTVLRRLADRLVVGEIHDEADTIVDQMERILVRIRAGAAFEFSTLFPDRTTLPAVIVTFLAMLELARLRKLAIRQTGSFGEVVIEPIGSDSPRTPPETAAAIPPN